jgi:hypothetical protein
MQSATAKVVIFGQISSYIAIKMRYGALFLLLFTEDFEGKEIE